MFDPMNLNDMLADELIQRREDGYDVAALEEPVRQALEHGSIEERLRLLKSVENTSRREDWSYHEPSQLEEIKATLAQPVALPQLQLWRGRTGRSFAGSMVGALCGL